MLTHADGNLFDVAFVFDITPSTDKLLVTGNFQHPTTHVIVGTTHRLGDLF